MRQYQIESVDINSFNQTAKERVEKIISGSPDMITALECVGAMYGIPSTHLTVEPEINVMKVSNDHVLCPMDVKPNTKAIVCAIGGVLDHISQRMNDKLDNQHDNEVIEGREHSHVSQNANPNKGKVISRHVDANGDEVIVYDSGLMDMANTKEAHKKADELKKDGKVPDKDIDQFSDEDSYFKKEEAIELEFAANIDLDLACDNEPRPTSIIQNIRETPFHIDLFTHYRDTDHLGYDLLQEQGFDFVKPTDAFTLEADAIETKPKINPEDIRHMKFDNTHITQAIKCFNQARGEQSDSEKGEFDLTKFIQSPHYKQGISELEKQFDCKLNVYFKDNVKKMEQNALYTYVFDHTHTDKIYVSKAKGFQLNGLPITIICENKAIDEEMTKNTDKELFGQFMAASLCHEIFHNIVNAIRCTTNMFIYTSTSAMALAMSSDDATTRREVFSRFADTIVIDGHELNHNEKKRLVKNLMYISALAENQSEMNELQKKIDHSKNVSEAEATIDEMIEKYEKVIDKYEDKIPSARKKGGHYLKHPHRYKFMNRFATGLSSTLIGGVIGLPMLKLLPNRADAAIAQSYNEYLSRKNKEEYYCDLFAGVYNVPLSFTYGFKNKEFVANDFPQEKLTYLSDLEKKLYEFMMSSYPTPNERNYTAYQIAKQILSGQEKISDECKKYCEWIVNNYSNLEKTNIQSNYTSNTFDPKEAQDLDKHVQNIILNNGIAVTESFIMSRKKV